MSFLSNPDQHMIVQLIHAQTGARSGDFNVTYDGFCEMVAKYYEGTNTDYMVLLLVEDIQQPDTTLYFSRWPLMYLYHFCDRDYLTKAIQADADTAASIRKQIEEERANV